MCACDSVYICTYPHRRNSALWYSPEEKRDRMKNCQMCGNAATDHFYHLLLWAQAWERVTCLRSSGGTSQSWLNEWWNEPDGKRTKQLPAKTKKEETVQMSGGVTGECSISYHRDLNPSKKKEQRRRGKLHSNGHETIDFIEKSLEKKTQLLRVLTSPGPSSLFLCLCIPRGALVLCTILFVVFTLIPRCVTSPLRVIHDLSCQRSRQPRAPDDWYVDGGASSTWRPLCLVRLWLMTPGDQGQDPDIWPPPRTWQTRRLMRLNKPVTAAALWSVTPSSTNGRG